MCAWKFFGVGVWVVNRPAEFFDISSSSTRDNDKEVNFARIYLARVRERDYSCGDLSARANRDVKLKVLTRLYNQKCTSCLLQTI